MIFFKSVKPGYVGSGLQFFNVASVEFGLYEKNMSMRMCIKIFLITLLYFQQYH